MSDASIWKMQTSVDSGVGKPCKIAGASVQNIPLVKYTSHRLVTNMPHIPRVALPTLVWDLVGRQRRCQSAAVRHHHICAYTFISIQL